MRFLVSRLSSLGDVVCSLPAASALRDAYPDCSITWAVSPRFAPVVRCCKAVNEVVEVKVSASLSSLPQYEGEYDCVLDLQGLLKSSLAVIRAKTKRRLGYYWQREGARFFSQRVIPDPSSFHIVDQYVDVARAAGGTAHRASFGLVRSEGDLFNVKAKLGGIGRYIVCNPGAGWASKRWPESHFATIADRAAENGFSTVLIGTGAEEHLAQSISSQCRSAPLSLTGKTSLGELTALLSECTAHIGGDTGSTHLAAALGRPAIGLYSITNPRRSCPYGQIERCLYDPSSLAHISPDAVFAKLDAVLR